MKLWIARDESGDIYLYDSKPERVADWSGGIWKASDFFELQPDSFPEVTFENSPLEVELKLINNENRR